MSKAWARLTYYKKQSVPCVIFFFGWAAWAAVLVPQPKVEPRGLSSKKCGVLTTELPGIPTLQVIWSRDTNLLNLSTFCQISEACAHSLMEVFQSSPRCLLLSPLLSVGVVSPDQVTPALTLLRHSHLEGPSCICLSFPLFSIYFYLFWNRLHIRIIHEL